MELNSQKEEKEWRESFRDKYLGWQIKSNDDYVRYSLVLLVIT